MQTFLPYDNLVKSLECLDYKRLGKQRVESYQIIKALTLPEYGWKNHPATKMWIGCLPCLKYYYDLSLDIWEARGYVNNMIPYEDYDIRALDYPDWFGDKRLHDSHKASLYRKDPEFYQEFKHIAEQEYWWPV